MHGATIKKAEQDVCEREREGFTFTEMLLRKPCLNGATLSVSWNTS